MGVVAHKILRGLVPPIVTMIVYNITLVWVICVKIMFVIQFIQTLLQVLGYLCVVVM